VTSHISVTAATSTTTPTGLSSSGKSQDSGPLGMFGAILDNLANVGKTTAATAANTDSATTTAALSTGFVQPGAESSASTTATSSTTASGGVPSILDLIEKLLGGKGNGDGKAADGTAATGGEGTSTVPLTATAAVDATTAIDASADAGTPPKLLKDVIDSLKAIDKAEQTGEPVTDDMLKKAKKAIDALSNFLAAQQPTPIVGTPASPTDGTDSSVAAIGSATGAPASTLPASAGADPDASPSDTLDGQKASAELATAKASLNALSSKLDALASATAKVDPDLASKLQDLAKSLDPSKLTGDVVRQLGLTASDAAADPQIAGAINGLVNGKAQTAASTTPTLAAPMLKLPAGGALGATDNDPEKATGIVDRPTTTSAAKSTAAPASPKPADASQTADDGKASTASATARADRAADAAKAATDTPPASSSGTNAGAAATAAVAATTNPTGDTSRLAQVAYQQSATPAAQLNIPQLAYEVVRHMQQGQNHFQIRLDPADLGRVDVKLAIDQTGAVNARLTVERPETLDLLRRDASQLGQAFSQAGLDGSKTNLQFSLSQNPFTRQDNGGQQGSSNYSTQVAGDDADGSDAVPAASAAVVYRGTASASGLNLIV